jgi:hypothetical protein
VSSVAANNDEVGHFDDHPPAMLAVVGRGRKGKAGALEAFACQGCGYTELYLKEALQVDGKWVQEVVGQG